MERWANVVQGGVMVCWDGRAMRLGETDPAGSEPLPVAVGTPMVSHVT